MSHPYTIVAKDDGSETLTVLLPDGPETIDDKHPNYQQVKDIVLDQPDAVQNQGLDVAVEIAELIDVEAAISNRFEPLSERVSVANGKVYFDGDEVIGSITNHIIRALEEDAPFDSLVNFLESVEQNPNEHSRKQLYAWLDAHDFTITPDGEIIGYKGVHDYTGEEDYVYQSGQSGEAVVDGLLIEGYIPQNVGSVVTMPRSAVEHDPGASCSDGLHVGTFGYAKGFAKPKDNVLMVAVNPRDVVSVPTDAGGGKVRVCRYEILEDKVTEESSRAVERKYVGISKFAPYGQVYVGDECPGAFSHPNPSSHKGTVDEQGRCSVTGIKVTS